MKKSKFIPELYHAMKKIVDDKLLPNDKKDFVEFINLLETIQSTASKETHYHELEESLNPIYESIRQKLYAAGFKNGEPEHNAKLPTVQFWWNIYSTFSSIIYSQFKPAEQCSLHHSSAHARITAMILECKELISKIYI